MDERARGGRCEVVDTFEVDGDLPFYDVEGLVVLPVDMQWRGHPSGGDLLDQREAPPGLLGGGLEGREGSEEPEGLSVPRA